MGIPILTRDAVRKIDRRAIEHYGIPGIVLMENAGRGCVDVLSQLGIQGPIAICCGKGNNAGDGFVIARHLDLRGHSVRLLTWSDPRELTGDAGLNYEIANRAGLPVTVFASSLDSRRLERHLEGVDWIVDALLGTGARGDPRSPLDVVIPQLNDHGARKLAVDLPSGLDCETGIAGTPTFRADHTCTFVAAKPGLVAPGAHAWVGQLHVLDIGTPRRLLSEFGL